MKNFIFIVICFIVLGLGTNACSSKSSTNPETTAAVIATADNSMVSVDWKGTYTGIIPCADCAGISIQITLRMDNTYSLQMEYLDKENSAQNFEGTFQWDNSGDAIILSGLEKESMPSIYKVGENKLIQLDMEGKVITGDLASNYVLIKK